jgi:hypothetical protein
MCQYYLIYQKATEATSENTTARKPASFLALNSKSSGPATVKLTFFRSLPSLFSCMTADGAAEVAVVEKKQRTYYRCRKRNADPYTLRDAQSSTATYCIHRCRSAGELHVGATVVLAI